MKTLALLLVPLVAACGLSGAEPPRTERAQTRLTRALDGLVAGPPQRCIPSFRGTHQEIVDRGTILYKNGRDLVFRNDPEGGCQGLDSSRGIVVSSIGSDYCRGDLVRVFDRTTGTTLSSCSYSDFIPYTRPPGRANSGGS